MLNKAHQAQAIPAGIFRAYDIRGIAATELTVSAVTRIARAIGEEALAAGIRTLLLARDGRLSGPSLSAALIAGLRRSGCGVVNLGMVPTPLLYFACHATETHSGVMLTASHNPPDYNGMKIVFRQAPLTTGQIQSIRTRADGMPNDDSGGNRQPESGEGTLRNLDIMPAYLARVCGDVKLQRPLRVVVDCGNAVAGCVAPTLFRQLGCDVIPLFCDIDGRFPNHHPDPTVPANLARLAAEVRSREADLGLAFDGDGDRLGLVDEAGRFIDADRILFLLLGSIAADCRGEPVIFDVKCTRELARQIAAHGLVPIMHRSGHSFMKQKMRETGAPLGGEYSAHIFIKHRWFGFDDGLYAAARLLEIFSQRPAPVSAAFAGFADHVSTREIALAVADARKFEIMERVAELAGKLDAELIAIDGIRAEFADGWGLARASNTSPAILLRFEGNDPAALNRIRAQFAELLRQAAPDLDTEPLSRAPIGNDITPAP